MNRNEILGVVGVVTVMAGGAYVAMPNANPFVMDVEWRAVSRNVPSRQMPRSVPWVHGLIQDAQGPSPRIELSPKRQENDHYPVHLILTHPNQVAVEEMGWDDTVTLTVDGYEVEAQKSFGQVGGWAFPEPWALVAELDADHPLVIHAAEEAAGPQAVMNQAANDFLDTAREWGDANFPHPDFMNVVRRLLYDNWNGHTDYWPGDPLPDVMTICQMARNQILGR